MNLDGMGAAVAVLAKVSRARTERPPGHVQLEVEPGAGPVWGTSSRPQVHICSQQRCNWAELADCMSQHSSCFALCHLRALRQKCIWATTVMRTEVYGQMSAPARNVSQIYDQTQQIDMCRVLEEHLAEPTALTVKCVHLHSTPSIAKLGKAVSASSVAST